MVEQLVAAGAAVDAKDKVRRGGGGGGGMGGRTQLCVSSWFSCFVLLKFGCTLASRISKGIGHVGSFVWRVVVGAIGRVPLERMMSYCGE